MAEPINQVAVATIATSSPPPARRRSESGEAIRQRIKASATDMFIRRGYNGVTFLDLGKELGINHSLVHYHFGTKAKLAEEVLRDFADHGILPTLQMWGDPGGTLFEKFVEARDRTYRRFILFNPAGKMQQAIGLVSRFTMDAQSLTPELLQLVHGIHESLDRCFGDAVRIAIDRGELRPDAPVHLIMLQISSILYFAGPTARYGWEFARLDNYFRATFETLMLAYGTQPALAPSWPKVKRPRGKAKSAV